MTSMKTTDNKMIQNLSMIVAAAEDGAIGRGGDLIWRISADLKRFKALTMGHSIIMGRKTWDSLPKGALPGRRNVVVTRDKNFSAEGADVYNSLEDAIDSCKGAETFIIGGAQIYRQAIPMVSKLFLTRVYASYPDADAFFPEIDPSVWEVSSCEAHPTDEKHHQAYRFIDYCRIQ
mgnify:CR=1 FL=1